MFPADIEDAADRLLKACRARDLWVTTAESCTGGLLGAALTCAPGTSEVFDRPTGNPLRFASTGTLLAFAAGTFTVLSTR